MVYYVTTKCAFFIDKTINLLSILLLLIIFHRVLFLHTISHVRAASVFTLYKIMDAKRKRCCNFTTTEKNSLVELLNADMIRIIDDKSNSNNSISRKDNAWKSVTFSYNSLFPMGSQRTTDDLKGMWKRIKEQSKCKKASMERERKATGGGPGQSQNEDDVLLDKVIDLIGKDISSLDNIYDNDNAGEDLMETCCTSTDSTLFNIDACNN